MVSVSPARCFESGQASTRSPASSSGRWLVNGSRFGRFDAPLDAPIVTALDDAFAASGTKLRSLATVLARTDAFYRPHFELARP